MNKNKKNEQGFSVLELLVVTTIALVLSAIAVPSLNAMLNGYRALGDAQRIAGDLQLARMRAAMDFTQTRIYVNLTSNTYRLDIWSKAGNAANPTGCWQTESALAGVCDAPTSAAATIPQDQKFSNKVVTGFGAAAAAPPSTQTVFGQAPNCLDNTGNPIANTACVVFNSRGIPITPGNPLAVNNQATANDAIYFTNAAGITYAVTVLASGKTSKWSYSNGAWIQR